MVVTTASEFRAAVREYRFDPFALDGEAITERLLAEWQGSAPLLVVTGAFHAAMQPYLEPEGETMTALFARERSGLVPAMLQYDNSPPMPSAPITFGLPKGTASVVPGVQSSWRTGT